MVLVLNTLRIYLELDEYLTNEELLKIKPETNDCVTTRSIPFIFTEDNYYSPSKGVDKESRGDRCFVSSIFLLLEGDYSE